MVPLGSPFKEISAEENLMKAHQYKSDASLQKILKKNAPEALIYFLFAFICFYYCCLYELLIFQQSHHTLLPTEYRLRYCSPIALLYSINSWLTNEVKWSNQPYLSSNLAICSLWVMTIRLSMRYQRTQGKTVSLNNWGSVQIMFPSDVMIYSIK